MKLNHIDSKQIGTLWHIHSSVAMLSDDKLHFYHMTSRDMPHGASHQISFSKPSFMNDLSSKVGFVDVVRLGTKAQFITTPEDFTSYCELVKDPNRHLPLIAIVQQNTQSSAEGSEFTDGYDMNTFTINGTRLAKVVGQYAHVVMIDQSLATPFADKMDANIREPYGCIVIFWPEEQKRTPDIFTKDDVCHAEFDFNRFAFHDNNISEKAFRHKLVQVIKDDNVSH